MPDYILLLHISYISLKSTNFEHTLKDGKSQWGRTFGKSSEKIFVNLYETRKTMVEFLESVESHMKMLASSVLASFDLSRFKHLCDFGGK